MEADTFEPLLNQKFKIRFSEEHEYEFELIEVTRRPFIESLSISPFILFFRGNKDLPIFNQGYYKLSHQAIGEISIFLNPRQPDSNGIYYEFIYN